MIGQIYSCTSLALANYAYQKGDYASESVLVLAKIYLNQWCSTSSLQALSVELCHPVMVLLTGLENSWWWGSSTATNCSQNNSN